MEKIKVETLVNAPMEKVWDAWTKPEHIVNWNFASEDWLCPNAINNLIPGGDFNWRMESKDGSAGFDYSGTYLNIEKYKSIKKKISDGREVNIDFSTVGDQVKVTETFETEDENSAEMQRQGWQNILDNFKTYVESN